MVRKNHRVVRFLTPPEIKHQPLRPSAEGYPQEAVDELLADVTASYEQVWRERDALRAQVQSLDDEVGARRESERALDDEVERLRALRDELHAGLRAFLLAGLELVEAAEGRHYYPGASPRPPG